MEKLTRIMLFVLPAKKRMALEEEIHQLCLSIQLFRANTEIEGWLALKQLPTTGLHENNPLVIIAPQNLDLIKKLRQKIPAATILVWDKKISNRQVKRAGGNSAFNFSHHLSMKLLREIINIAE